MKCVLYTRCVCVCVWCYDSVGKTAGIIIVVLVEVVFVIIVAVVVFCLLVIVNVTFLIIFNIICGQ